MTSLRFRRPNTTRTAALIVAAGSLCLLLGGCSGNSSAHAATGQTLVLYNAQHEQTTNAIIAAFEKQTGIKVVTDNDDEDTLTAKIEQEGSQSPADLIYTENSNWLVQLDQAGLLAPVDSSTLANVPNQDSGTDGNWVGVSARVSGLVYNTNDLSAAQLPTSVMQLADPAWKGKIEVAPAETDFWPVIDLVDRQYGDAATLNWLAGLKANAGANDNVPDNETLTSDVSQGITQLALINSYYLHRLQDELGANAVHASFAPFAAGDAGYVEGISGAAILKSSTHRAAAQQFLQFLTSTAGQTVIAHSESFEYPLAHGVAANSALPPLSTLSPANFTPAELGTGITAKTLLQQAGLL